MDIGKGLRRLISQPPIQSRAWKLDDYLPIKEAAKLYRTSDDTLRRCWRAAS